MPLITLLFRKKNTWLFSSWFGGKISDNSKYFYDDLNDIDNNIFKVWIVKNKELHDSDKNIYYYLSICGLYYQVVSSAVLCTHSLYSDFYPLAILLNRGIKVQLWHGTPLKKIMWDVPTTKLGSLKRKVFDRYDAVVCPNENFSHIYARAFKVSKDKVIVSGCPRVRKNNSDVNSGKILYAPTFRDDSSKCTLFDEYKFDIEKAESYLSEHNKVLYVRLHPHDTLDKKWEESINKSKYIHFDKSVDIYAELNTYDILITDYSSVYFDFLPYDKPIVFAPFDLEKYEKKLRGTYFSYKDVTSGPYAYNWDDVLRILKNNQFELDKLRVLKNKYSQNIEIQSSQLIYEFIKGKM